MLDASCFSAFFLDLRLIGLGERSVHPWDSVSEVMIGYMKSGDEVATSIRVFYTSILNDAITTGPRVVEGFSVMLITSFSNETTGFLMQIGDIHRL